MSLGTDEFPPEISRIHDLIPENIPPARRLMKRMAVFFLACAFVMTISLCLVVYYVALDDNIDFPAFLYLPVAAIPLFVFVGVYLLIWPESIGASVDFSEAGFILRVRLLFRKTKEHNFSWANVKDIFVFPTRPMVGPIRIRTLTGETAEFPAHIVATTSDETLARFRASANAAGYRLEKTDGCNADIFTKQIWTVSRGD